MRDALPEPQDRTRLTAPRVRVVGCGNPDAGDDAAGLIIAGLLRQRVSPDVEVRMTAAGGVNLLDWCDEVGVLILVDAVLATREFPAGQWTRFAFPSDRLRLHAAKLSGTHTLGIVPALELAHTLKQLPPEVLLFGVAGERFGRRTELSPAIRLCIPDVLSAIEKEIGRCLHSLH